MKDHVRGSLIRVLKKTLLAGGVCWACGFSRLLPPTFAADDLPPLPKGPLLLTSVKPEQLKPDYWISRLENPDKVLMTPSQLKVFNEDIRSMVKERVDVFAMPQTRAGKPIRDQLRLEFKTLRGRVLFDKNDVPVPKTVFDKEIDPRMRIDKVPARIAMRWGAAIRATSIRALPTDRKMIEARGDVEFDQIQFTLIKLWTPVGIFHSSADGKWFYVQAPYVRGWVKAKDIAVFTGRDQLKKFSRSSEFLCVTGESIPVFSDPGLKTVLRRATMGTVLPLAGKGAAAYSVWMPFRGQDGRAAVSKAYVSLKSDVTKGFPPYTQRNVIRQAFKLMGARYGWGGMYNGRDCSGFTHDVFLSMGVDMPRDSKQLAYIGTQIGHFEPFESESEKKAVLRSGKPGVTLIRMPKHIMLYLGEVNGQFYVIHSTWAERVSMTSDAKNRINQVVVSDLNLNGKSRIGSLFDRIVSVNEMR